MIGRRAVVGLSLLSALLFCAFAAQSASAALKTSTNTTGFTCVKGVTEKGDFKDEHCDETNVGKGAFKHELIPLNTTTEVEFSNEKSQNRQKIRAVDLHIRNCLGQRGSRMPEGQKQSWLCGSQRRTSSGPAYIHRHS
jgi:hypothetical protein